MNWLNFLLFVLLYAAACLPMYAAGHTKDLRTKVMLAIVDAMLTITAYIYLWYSFPSALYSLIALIVWWTVAISIGKAMLRRGYDPYAELRP